MDNFIKKLILTICISCKPPVFLTLSILIIIGYLTFVVLKSILNETINYLLNKQSGDPTIILLTFIILFGSCWVFFFLSLAKYEIDNELVYYLRVFQSSQRGLRCIPVTIGHFIYAIFFEIIIYKTVNGSVPKDKIVNNFSLNHHYNVNEKFHAVFVYTLWTCSIIYSLFYFLSEEIVILFCREDTLIEYIHGHFIRLLLRTTGIDLSDLPSGDYNQALERLMDPLQDEFIPPSQAEYNQVKQRTLFKRSLSIFRKRSLPKLKDQKYLSWNTIR